MAARPFCFACVTSLLVLVPVLLLCSSLGKAQTTEYCTNVFEEFSSCLGFLGELSPEPTAACCDSLTSLNSLAQQEDSGPRMICECIESSSYWTRIPFSASRIQELPTSCQLHLSFPISNSMDCSKLN
ncbi:putative plant lipid transfer protein/Par allergen [Rosa chinensis]|uniref:Putative plant lipid transfer protein/Par allergen n=1 Tax=Rosa chinensis TaxID=74649 RepID=A0A2P6RU37_ROSCH|nr:non-specific lipid-transfer protein 13-like [Rosa chinensis]PRQ49944.1 putative plant lipid transfer protein/Par allergen [Rosa chinensis]